MSECRDFSHSSLLSSLSMCTQSLLGSSFVGSDDQQFRSRYAGGIPNGQDSLFSESNHSAGNSRSPAPPGFSASDFLSSDSRSKTTLSPDMARHFPDTNTTGLMGSFDRQFIGENLVRSQSAAPSFDGGFSMGPPPGLARRETPLVSNRSSRNTISQSAMASQRDSYLEASVDRSQILQLGQRRPASTGVIGGNQTSSLTVLDSLGLGTGNGAVRPAAKTLMDLIQEDFPPESPALEGGDFYGNDFQQGNIYAIERPRTTSPLSSQYNSLRSDNYLYPGQNDGELFESSTDRLRLGRRGEVSFSGRNSSLVSFSL